jgi:hypothetical protein
MLKGKLDGVGLAKRRKDMERVSMSVLIAVALLVAAPVRADMSFTDVTETALVGDTAHTYGSCLADYDSDGSLDIFSANIILTSNLYRNTGGMVFSNVTGHAGLVGLVEAKGSSMADYDNDGDLDMALVGWNRDSFYRNNGDGTFTEYSDSANFAIDDTLHGMSCVWADYDKDSHADLFVTNLGGGSVLYRNMGDGTFEDATVDAGIDCADATGAVWFDYDMDDDADLFVCRYLGYPDYLYENDGLGHFREVGSAAGVAGDDSSFGCAAGDVDSDGDFDLYVSKFHGAGTLYRNNGDGSFSDITGPAGVDISGSGTGCVFEDFDSDLDVDLYVGCFYGENHLFENDGAGVFTDVTVGAGVGDYGDQRTGVGISAADLDSDGDVDIYCGNHKRNTLFRNDTQTSLLAPSNRLVLKLRGTMSNRSAIGARVYVTTSGGTQMREVTAGSGVCSMSSLELEFGLGSSTGPFVEIRWPSGLIESGMIEGSGYVEVVEGSFPGVLETELVRMGALAALYQNEPNPFRRSTRIQFCTSASADVSISVYDVKGRRVCELLDSWVPAGTHALDWDGTVSGVRVPVGVYIYSFEGNGISESRKMAIVR